MAQTNTPHPLDPSRWEVFDNKGVSYQIKRVVVFVSVAAHLRTHQSSKNNLKDNYGELILEKAMPEKSKSHNIKNDRPSSKASPKSSGSGIGSSSKGNSKQSDQKQDWSGSRSSSKGDSKQNDQKQDWSGSGSSNKGDSKQNDQKQDWSGSGSSSKGDSKQNFQDQVWVGSAKSRKSCCLANLLLLALPFIIIGSFLFFWF